MHRFAALLLCSSLAAFAAWAAPAPVYRPKPSRVWGVGWDRPIDPAGGCRFDRDGDTLTITIPGGVRDIECDGDRPQAPRLLRDIEGDFAVEVRVGGRHRPKDPKQGGVRWRAGILVTDGKHVVKMERAVSWGAGLERNLWTDTFSPGNGVRKQYKGLPLAGKGHLRLSRSGDDLTLEASEDGKNWVAPARVRAGLREKVKVGVVAETAADGHLEVEFDEFSLTSLK